MRKFLLFLVLLSCGKRDHEVVVGTVTAVLNCDKDGVAKSPRGKTEALCSLFENDQILVMQFSGVYCLPCQDEAKAFSEYVKTHPRLRHAVAFIDSLDSEIPIEDFVDFMERNSPTSLLTFDGTRKLYSKLYSAKGVKFGVTLAVNKQGKMHVAESIEGGDRLAEFLEEAEKLLK